MIIFWANGSKMFIIHTHFQYTPSIINLLMTCPCLKLSSWHVLNTKISTTDIQAQLQN